MSQDLPIDVSTRGPESFTGAGGQTVFTGSYPLQNPEDVAVEISVDAGVTWARKALNTDYTVTVGTPTDGFTVTLTVGITAGWKLRHYGLAPIQRTADFSPANTLKRAGLNADLDRNTIIEQELRRDLGRAVSVPVGDNANTLLPIATARANAGKGSLLGFDPASGGLSLYDPSTQGSLITPRHVLKVTDYCKCDGGTDDAAGLVALAAAANAFGCVQIEFPALANVLVWSNFAAMVANPMLMHLTGLRNSVINFNGALCFSNVVGLNFTGGIVSGTNVVTVATPAQLGLTVGMPVGGVNSTQGVVITAVGANSITVSVNADTTNGAAALRAYPIGAGVITLDNCANIEINGYRFTSAFSKVEFSGFAHITPINGCAYININGGLAAGGSVGLQLARGHGSAAARSHHIHTTLEYLDVYYPADPNWNADFLTGTLKSTNAGRPFLNIGGILGLDIFVHAINATSQMVLAATAADDDASLMQGRVLFCDAGTTAGGSIVPIEIRSGPATAGTTAKARIDLDLHLDIDQTSRSYDTVVTTDSQNVSLATGPYAADWNLRIGGSIKGNASTAFMNLGTAALGFGSGMDVDITLRDLKAPDMTRPLNVGASQYVHGIGRNLDAPQSVLTAEGAFVNRSFTGVGINLSGLSAGLYVTQDVLPAGDNGWVLGTASVRWADLRSAAATINSANVTTINKYTLTPPATAATLTIANNKTFTVNNTITLQGTDATVFTLPTATDTLAGLAAAQTLTNKTLTAPTINGGTHTAITSFGIRSSGAAFDVTLASTEALTAGRVLNIFLGDATRALNLSGTLTIAAAFTTAGANALTLTTTGPTNVTLPTSGTLVNTVSPTFTGAVTGDRFVPAASTVPANGMYLPAANTVGLASNSTVMFQMAQASNLGRASAFSYLFNPPGANAVAFRGPGTSGVVGVFDISNSADTQCGGINMDQTAHTVAYNTSSDGRGKPIRVPLADVRAKIDALKAYDFRDERNQIRAVGFVAQDAYSVIDHMVTPGDTDVAEWHPEHPSWRMWQVDKSEAVPYLVADAQETHARLDVLEQITRAVAEKLGVAIN